MVHGIGIDIVQTDRIRQAVERWDRKFLERIFTDVEIEYSCSKKDPYLPLSVRFAAKEAFIKAASFDRAVSFKDIEIRNMPGGRPVFELHGEVGRFIKEQGINNILLSMSHEQEYGAACVVMEKDS